MRLKSERRQRHLEQGRGLTSSKHNTSTWRRTCCFCLTTQLPPSLSRQPWLKQVLLYHFGVTTGHPSIIFHPLSIHPRVISDQLYVFLFFPQTPFSACLIHHWSFLSSSQILFYFPATKHRVFADQFRRF